MPENGGCSSSALRADVFCAVRAFLHRPADRPSAPRAPPGRCSRPASLEDACEPFLQGCRKTALSNHIARKRALNWLEEAVSKRVFLLRAASSCCTRFLCVNRRCKPVLRQPLFLRLDKHGLSAYTVVYRTVPYSTNYTENEKEYEYEYEKEHEQENENGRKSPQRPVEKSVENLATLSGKAVGRGCRRLHSTTSPPYIRQMRLRASIRPAGLLCGLMRLPLV